MRSSRHIKKVTDMRTLVGKMLQQCACHCCGVSRVLPHVAEFRRRRSVPTVAQRCLVGPCYCNVVRRYTQQCSNTDLGAHCCATVTLINDQGCPPPRQSATDKHVSAHKVFTFTLQFNTYRHGYSI